jgi:hypothetical protein
VAQHALRCIFRTQVGICTLDLRFLMLFDEHDHLLCSLFVGNASIPDWARSSGNHALSCRFSCSPTLLISVELEYICTFSTFQRRAQRIQFIVRRRPSDFFIHRVSSNFMMSLIVGDHVSVSFASLVCDSRKSFHVTRPIMPLNSRDVGCSRSLCKLF